MSRPTDDLSDDQLTKGLASGEFAGRDALIAEEILKRRHSERTKGWVRKWGIIGAMAAAVSLWLKLRLKRARTK
jgi:hypothetical protein